MSNLKMIGTEKQIAWATDILENAKNVWFEHATASIEALESTGRAKSIEKAAVIKKVSNMLNELNDAAFIIENKKTIDEAAIFPQYAMGNIKSAQYGAAFTIEKRLGR